MKSLIYIWIGLWVSINLTAQPNMSDRHLIQEVIIYGDESDKNTFYYAPKTIQLDENEEGEPSFSFVKMTHIGSRSRGTETWKQSSMIQFTISPRTLSSKQLKYVKGILKERICQSCKLRFLPMPIKKMEAHLVYVDLETNKEEILTANYTKNDSKEKFEGGIWNTKTFTIRPDKHTTQIIWDGIKKEKGVLSVAYALWGNGKYTDSISYMFNGPKELAEVFHNLNNDSLKTKEEKASGTLISTGAYAVDVDINKWPELLNEISFESTLSPRYGLIDVYCYDFTNQIRPDLVAKLIEFQAEGVRNKKVTSELEFNKDSPDVYAYELRFKYAVRLDKPLRYKVIELTQKGEVIEGSWQQKENWTGIIDVSSQKDFEENTKNEEK
ncbi:hypothetical protein [Aquimarina sp. AU474]|uniref:hypothetical protein n=1 Tax=Aquimarina sp. AU474 TaxID=2108529 RepID=UPI000D68ACB3|nr:hypothetical protein [Aquimarina sp. AU474]